MIAVPAVRRLDKARPACAFPATSAIWPRFRPPRDFACTATAPTPAARSARPTSARTSGCPAGATASATMAACCSSTCATITASPRWWPTRISPAFKIAETLRSEWVVRIDGKVRGAPGRHREPGPADRRGRGLYHARSRCSGRPANCRCRCSAIRNIRRRSRLKYRFLDLRREKLHQNIMMRGAGDRFDPPPHEGAGLLRIPDADPDRVVAGRRARLPGAVAAASRQVLRAAAGAAAVQAAAHGRRASTATSRSRRASATRTRAPTVRPASSTSSISR